MTCRPATPVLLHCEAKDIQETSDEQIHRRTAMRRRPVWSCRGCSIVHAPSDTTTYTHDSTDNLPY
jgi:Zn-finger protein